MKQIYIILTKKCNLKCDYCIRDYEINKNNSISLEDALFVFNQINKTYKNIPQIILSGGEPTFLNDFHEIFSLAKDLFKDKLLINSNGTTPYFLSKKFRDGLEKENEFSVQISLDGSENFHDSIRGKNSFKKSIETIEFLCSKNIKVIVATTVTSYAFINDFEEINNYLIDIPIKKWTIKRVNYSGRANSNNYQYLNSQEWNKIVDYVKERDESNFIEIGKQFDFSILDNFTDNQVKNIKSNKNCGSGIEKIYIYPNLDVLACTCYERFPSGNLRERSLSEILISKSHFSIINDLVKSPICNSCRYKKICNGGCLGSGFSRENKLGLADIKCPKIVFGTKL